jgi:hypothetical protein
MSTPTFEERYTAWIDGRLTGEDLVAFERELDAQDRPGADADRLDAHQLRSLLQRVPAPPMPNPDLFHEQLLQRMKAEEQTAPTPVPAHERPAMFTLTQLAWAAAICLLVAFSVYNFGHRETGPVASLGQPSPTVAMLSVVQILDADPKSPNVFATPIHSDKENLTVLWLDGLDYLPASYQLK